MVAECSNVFAQNRKSCSPQLCKHEQEETGHQGGQPPPQRKELPAQPGTQKVRATTDIVCIPMMAYHTVCPLASVVVLSSRTSSPFQVMFPSATDEFSVAFGATEELDDAEIVGDVVGVVVGVVVGDVVGDVVGVGDGGRGQWSGTVVGDGGRGRRGGRRTAHFRPRRAAVGHLQGVDVVELHRTIAVSTKEHGGAVGEQCQTMPLDAKTKVVVN